MKLISNFFFLRETVIILLDADFSRMFVKKIEKEERCRHREEREKRREKRGKENELI